MHARRTACKLCRTYLAAGNFRTQAKRGMESKGREIMEEFGIKTSIYFGKNALEYLKKLQGAGIFIVTDPFMVESGLVERITGYLEKDRCTIFSNVVPDPPLELVIEGVKEVIKHRPDTLIALGGGSAIDEAKAIMHFSRQIGNLPDMEFIAVPTTSGTGSEVTSFAVITDREKGIKYPLVDQSLLPDTAILDASLVKSVPKTVVADTGMDVLTHALEAYVSIKANAFTDALAEKAAVTVLRYLIRSYTSQEDFRAREEMHNASCMAGLAFDRTSLGVNHAIAHNIGGKFKVPHGRTNAVLLPYVVEFNADMKEFNPRAYTRAAEKYAAIAQLAGIGGGNVRAGVKNLVREIRKMQEQMKMPFGFKDCGILPEEYQKQKDAVAQGALADACIRTNPREVSREDILELLKRAYQGIR